MAATSRTISHSTHTSRLSSEGVHDPLTQAGPYVVEQVQCRNQDHMNQVLEEVLMNGGEGCVSHIFILVSCCESHSHIMRGNAALH